MRMPVLARHLLISITVLGLGACAGPPAKRLGDTSTPLMTPGHGLVATTWVYRSRTLATGAPTNGFSARRVVAFYDPKPNGGGAAFVVQPFGTTLASFVAKRRFDDADPGFAVFLTPAKPGKYALQSLLVNDAKEQVGVWPKDSPTFEVVAGQVTYAGSLHLMTRMEQSLGVYVARDMSVQVVDDYALDAAELRALEPRLGTAVMKNGLAK